MDAKKILLDSALETAVVESGSGPLDVVLVHGLCENYKFWLPTMVRFSSKAIRFIAYDLRGHGNGVATDDDYTFNAHAQDLAEIIMRYCKKPPIIIGHSMGGAVLQTLLHIMPSLSSLSVLLHTTCKNPQFVKEGFDYSKYKQLLADSLKNSIRDTALNISNIFRPEAGQMIVGGAQYIPVIADSIENFQFTPNVIDVETSSNMDIKPQEITIKKVIEGIDYDYTDTNRDVVGKTRPILVVGASKDEIIREVEIEELYQSFKHPELGQGAEKFFINAGHISMTTPEYFDFVESKVLMR